MLVSLLIPTYNHENYIEDCINGIMSQLFTDVELIISDDCSQDKTWDIICNYRERLEKKFPKVILKRNEVNLGIPKNLNSMLKIATSKWIKFCAGDDILTPDAITSFVSASESNPDVSFWVSDGYIIGEEDRFGNLPTDKTFYRNKPSFEGNVLKSLYIKNYIFAPSIMLKSELYERYGYYDESIGIDDWNQWLLFALNNVRFEYLDEYLVYYRESNSSMTSLVNNANLQSRRERILEATLGIQDKYSRYVGNEIWAECKLISLLEELQLAKESDLLQYKKIVNNKIIDFKIWRSLEIRKAIGYLYAFIVILWRR